MIKHLKIIENNKASKGLRIANFVIDKLVISMLFFSFGVFSFLTQEFLGIDYFINLADQLESFTKLEDTLVSTFVYVLYLICIEYFTKGKSIGKYITGTKIVMIDGTEPSFSNYMIRTLTRIIPFDALSFLGENGWHDKWSDTRVINIRAYKSDLAIITDLDSLGSKEF